MKSRLIAPLALAVLLAAGPADENDELRQGVKLYNSGKVAEALEAFLKAEKADPEAPLPKYNAMAIMAETEKLNELERKLTADYSALGASEEIRAKSAYNLGTAYLKLVDTADKSGQLPMRAKELDSAINWLRQALLDDSVDPEAKSNLEYANKLKEKLEKQQQDQQNKDENKDKQNQQDQKEDQQNQQDQNQQNEQEQNQQKQQNQQNREQQQEREISDDMARNLLEAARDAEKKALKMLREQMNKKAGRKPRKEKDW